MSVPRSQSGTVPVNASFSSGASGVVRNMFAARDSASGFCAAGPGA